jgi:hypothetical protein
MIESEFRLFDRGHETMRLHGLPSRAEIKFQSSLQKAFGVVYTPKFMAATVNVDFFSFRFWYRPKSIRVAST